MANILVIDDSPFWRDLAADALRLKGHRVTACEDFLAGLEALNKTEADLVILEAQLSGRQGAGFIEHLRRTPRWRTLPIIILTSEMEKEHVIRAGQLGVVDYVLKTHFSLKDLMDRVERRLDPQGAAPAPAGLPAAASPAVPRQLSTRERCLARAAQVLGARTLSGVVSQVIASASSPRTDMSELADLVGHDPMLSARVVAAANRLENAADRRVIHSLMDAVRVVGSATIRDIASSFWVYDAMPAPEPDGYNPIRCWQHSIAVARLCQRLATDELRPVAYLLGLCHDLGEILFRSHFGTEYRQVLEAVRLTGLPRADLEKQMLGLTRGELAQSILKQLTLPDTIQQPIAAFHAAIDNGSVPGAPAARLLMIADAFSSGLMLNSSDQTGVRPIHRSECRAATGMEDPPPADWAMFQAEVVALTAECARLSSKENARWFQPVFQRRALKVWLARDPSFSSLDPVAAALEAMVELSIHTRLPAQAELKAQEAVIVLVRNSATQGMTPIDLQQCLGYADAAGCPVLYLCGKGSHTGEYPSITFANWPVSIPKLAAFIGGVK